MAGTPSCRGAGRFAALVLPVAFFAALLAAAPASAATFSNPAAITINDTPIGCGFPAGQETATPYPAQIQVSGLSGAVTDVNVTLPGFSHADPADVRALLVGPGGQTTLLMHNAGGYLTATNLTLIFDDAAASELPEPLVSGTFRPSQHVTGCPEPPPAESLPSPAPAGPYGATLATLNGTNPNGAWSLYLVDTLDGGGAGGGTISGGWSLDITTPSTQAAAGEGRKCKVLRKKRKRQNKGLARAGSERKRSLIAGNIEDTKRRVTKLRCG